MTCFTTVFYTPLCGAILARRQRCMRAEDSQQRPKRAMSSTLCGAWLMGRSWIGLTLMKTVTFSNLLPPSSPLNHGWILIYFGQSCCDLSVFCSCRWVFLFAIRGDVIIGRFLSCHARSFLIHYLMSLSYAMLSPMPCQVFLCHARSYVLCVIPITVPIVSCLPISHHAMACTPCKASDRLMRWMHKHTFRLITSPSTRHISWCSAGCTAAQEASRRSHVALLELLVNNGWSLDVHSNEKQVCYFQM